MRALGDAVIVREIEEGQKKIGSIFVPGTADQHFDTGIVVSKGRGVISGSKIIPLDVEVGDKVLYNNTPKVPITVEGEELFIIQGGQILAVL